MVDDKPVLFVETGDDGSVTFALRYKGYEAAVNDKPNKYIPLSVVRDMEQELVNKVDDGG